MLLALSIFLNPLGMLVVLFPLVDKSFLFLVKKGFTTVLCSFLTYKAKGSFSGLKKLLEMVLVIAVKPSAELLGLL